MMQTALTEWLTGLGVPGGFTVYVINGGIILAIIVFSYLAYASLGEFC